MTEQGPQSGDTRAHSRRMQLVAEKQLPDPLPPPSTSNPTTPTTTIPVQTQLEFQKEVLTRTAWRASVLGALNVITAVLAVRLIVLVGVGGGIALTYIALQQPDQWRLGALAIYGVLVMVPVVWLAGRSR